MAAVEVTISGVLYDKYARTTRPVVLIGEASLTNVGIGGGPVLPPEGGGGDGIWGPTDPRPQPPIALPPGYPGKPPGFWGPNDPRPQPPIYIPPQLPEVPPPSGGGDKPPPATGGWGYVAQWDSGAPGGWGYFPAQADKPHPLPPENPDEPQVNPLR